MLTALDGRYMSRTLVDAKGDMIVGTAADTVARLAVGANGAALVADSTQTTGLRWDAPIYFSYRRTAALNFTTGPQDVAWDSVPLEGTLAGFTTSDRITFTCSVAGLYSISAFLTATNVAAASVSVNIYKAGSVFRQGYGVTNTTAYTGLVAEALTRFTVGQTFKIAAAGGSTVAAVATAITTALDVRRVGA
jgi:hypothetical protein